MARIIELIIIAIIACTLPRSSLFFFIANNANIPAMIDVNNSTKKTMITILIRRKTACDVLAIRDHIQGNTMAAMHAKKDVTANFE